MDKALLTGVVITTGGCGVVKGISVQEMLLYVLILLFLSLCWQMAYALWKCRKIRKRLDGIIERRNGYGLSQPK